MSTEIYFPEPPKVIFKYFSPERSNILKSLRIRFANPAIFNDPFEAYPRFDTFAEKVANDTIQKLTVSNNKLGIPKLESSISLGEYKNELLPERIKFHNLKFQKECGERFRMLCFCESVQSPLMWGHYCNSHKGFALQFDTGHPFFYNRLAKVQYENQRPQIDDPLAGVRIPLTKNSEWEYEKEWRIVHGVNSIEPYFETLPAECISAVYFGLRISPDVRWDIENALDSENRTHIKKFEMTLDVAEYKLIPVLAQDTKTSSANWIGDAI